MIFGKTVINNQSIFYLVGTYRGVKSKSITYDIYLKLIEWQVSRYSRVLNGCVETFILMNIHDHDLSEYDRMVNVE